MKQCAKCILPETYPGISFDARGVCNYCNYFIASKHIRESLRKNLKIEFHKIIEQTKETSKEYDCVVCYSGGKDSTFLLMELMDKYNLKILAYTLNHGFLSKKALENIKKMVECMGIDHMMFMPEKKIIDRIFRDALIGKIIYPKEITAILSPLCAVCQGMILALSSQFRNVRFLPK